MNVAVYGASSKQHRYSYMALARLLEKGHRVFPIHPRINEIEGIRVYRDLASIPESVHTVTLYVGPGRQEAIRDDLCNTDCQRVIFNPGTENPELQAALTAKGVAYLEACTLVMLSTDQFETK